MDSFLENVEKYELLLELILTAVSLFISVFVVIQTKNLAKRQAKQDLELAERQNELQKRQIRLELFERKFKTKIILKQIFDVSHFVFIFEKDTDKTLFLNSEDDVLHCVIGRGKEINKGEFSEVFSRSKYIFEQSLYKDISCVCNRFENVLRMSEIIDIVKEDDGSETYEKFKKLIFSSLKEISEKENSIMKRIEKELDVSKIDK